MLLQGASVNSSVSPEAAAAWHTFFRHLLLLAASDEEAAGLFAFMLQHPPLAPLARELAAYFAADLCPWLAAQARLGSQRQRALHARAQAVERTLRQGVQVLGAEDLE